jgi:hypothetical protein
MYRSPLVMPAQSVTANRLTDGAVVWLTAAGDWSISVRDAAAYPDESAAKAGLEKASADEARQLVVAFYAVDVVIEAAGPWPVKIRERIRASGPTVRTDLGRQAAAAVQG